MKSLVISLCKTSRKHVGWMTCDFTSFLTVFRSYRDNERVVMKVVCNETLFTIKKKLCLWQGSNQGLVGQSLTY